MKLLFGKRKISGILLALILGAASLSGCGSSENAADTATTASASTEEKSVETAATVEENPAEYITDGDYSQVKAGICVLKDADTELTDDITSFLTDKGVPEENISLNRDADSSSKAGENAQQMLSGDISVLFVDAGSRDAIPDIADAAARRGKSVIFIGTAPSSDEQQRWEQTDMIHAFYAGPDTSQTAARQGDILSSMKKEDLDRNKNDKIGMLVIDTDADVISKEMKDRDLSADVLGDEDAGGRSDTASQKVKEALDDHKDDLEVIVCGNDDEALSAVQAVQDADKTPGKDIIVVGAGASDEALSAISEGTLSGTVYGDTYEQARRAAQAAFDFLSGKGKSGTFLSDEISVTQSNVQEIIDYRR